MTPLSYDLVVVGAGMVGAWATYLTRRRHPHWRTLTIDASLAGRAGATLHSAGLAVPYARNAQQATLVAESERLLARHGIPGLHRDSIALRFVVPEADAADLAAQIVGATLRPASGRDIANLRAAYPDLRIAHDEMAFATDVDSWTGDASAHARALADAAVNEGATLWECTSVSRITPRRQGALTIETSDGHVLEAGAAIVATGPWMSDLCDWLPAPSQPRIKRVVAGHANVAPHPHAPVVLFPNDDFFILPQPMRQRHLFSFHRDAWPDRVDGGPLTADDRCAADRAVRRRSERLAVYFGGGQAFCDAYTAERVQFIEAHPANPRLLAVGGAAGSGFRLAPAMASRALDALDEYQAGAA